MSSEDTPLSADPAVIVDLIQQGNPKGEELLYTILSRGLRYLAVRKLGEEGNDCFHEVFLVLIRRIREGGLKEPAALFGYARTILTREMTDRFEQRRKWNTEPDFEQATMATSTAAPTPEALYESQRRTQILQKGLKALRAHEREILVRFYLEGQDPETICREMNLTETQYRLLKNRSKQKLEAFTQNYLDQFRQNTKPMAQTG